MDARTRQFTTAYLGAAKQHFQVGWKKTDASACCNKKNTLSTIKMCTKEARDQMVLER